MEHYENLKILPLNLMSPDVVKSAPGLGLYIQRKEFLNLFVILPTGNYLNKILLEENKQKAL